MKLPHDKVAAYSQTHEKANRTLNRRRFVEGAAAVGAMAGLDASWDAVAAASGSAAADNRLPDGTEETEDERAGATGPGQGHSPAMRPSVWARRRA